MCSRLRQGVPTPISGHPVTPCGTLSSAAALTLGAPTHRPLAPNRFQGRLGGYKSRPPPGARNSTPAAGLQPPDPPHLSSPRLKPRGLAVRPGAHPSTPSAGFQPLGPPPLCRHPGRRRPRSRSGPPHHYSPRLQPRVQAAKPGARRSGPGSRIRAQAGPSALSAGPHKFPPQCRHL
ncbi:hypothetical protein NDU88_000835 [Pleurodeles waltl]|uniref:Basic proline-rich protein-like n=1 Tax=Pleurodeles waltl TaxID=8319 RepID=A0AAV7P6Y1_PLEWA|nr:hypothetical protein NDU88_000835 [Pleurodeles waltl]